MFTSIYNHSERTISSILTSALLALFMISCSTDSGSGPSLDGDLRYQVEGSEGETVYISVNRYTESGGSFESIGEVTISSTGTAEGDLKDGNYTGYQLQASPRGEDQPDVTLKLLGDGEVLGKTSETNNNGIFMVEVGDIPDHDQ